MPTTLNGIGTHYYGKKDLETRVGVCEHCGKEATLRTYETRLWFVIVFVPIIPLGKKQILDECSRCTMHRALPLDEWERIKNEAVSETLGKASADPDDPEAAVDLLGTLYAFKRRDEAREMARIMTQKFADNADVQLQLAAYYDENGEHDKADECCARALELEPGSRDARRAVAVGCIEKGDLERAAELLDFMTGPGPDQDPAVLNMLAAAYHERNRDEDALKLYKSALQGFPSLGKDRQFRKAVRASEKALGHERSMLPASAARRRVAVVAAVIALVVGALFGINAFLSARQTLHIVNALPEPARIEIDGNEPVTVAASGREEITISEGRHGARITRKGAPEETVAFEVENSFGERWGGDSVFILNVGGAATFQWQEIIYSAPGTGRQPQAGLLIGKTFLTVRDIDYAFEDPPRQMKTESSSVTKRHVEVFNVKPVQLFGYLMQERPPGEAMSFAERHLKLGTLGDQSVQVYYVVALKQNETERCRKFLETGLDDRPVRIEWHRFYQGLREEAGGEAELIAKYDRMLAEDPKSSALLYLRGRVEPDSAAAMKYFKRAAEADAASPYPWRARGYFFAIRGDFAKAKERYAEAVRLGPDDWVMTAVLTDMRLALGEHKALEAELRDALSKDPYDSIAQRDLLHALALQGRLGAAEEAHRDFVAQLEVPPEQKRHPLELASRMNLLHLRGDHAGIVEAAGEMEDQASAAKVRFMALLEMGDLERAATNLANTGYVGNNTDYLLMSLAWQQRGSAQKAQEWRQKAIAALASGSRGERRTAKLLQKGDALQLDEVVRLDMRPRVKRTVLVALAATCPAKRKELLAMARKFNYSLWAPHRFLKRTIEAMEK